MSDYKPHPLRVQLRRTKGWRKPDGAVVVARPSKWGNPMEWLYGNAADNFRDLMDGKIDINDLFQRLRHWSASVAELAAHLERLSERRLMILSTVHLLRGKQLCCWCPLDQPCHADVLAELANA